MLGGTIGSYRLLSKLGEGGMGSVWAAEHTLLGRRAAIKVLLPELSSRADIVERFFNEAKASTAIGDLGVVQIFDFGFHDGRAFIVMELLDGESLVARLHNRGTLALRDALRMTRQLAQTLANVHARGVIHRDLKPDNIFLVRDSEAEGGERTKILDFGIAKLSETEGGVSKTRTGSLLGTPLYMSPEQCRGAGEVDRRSDVYAIGCVLFHMICGRPPFDGEGPGDVLIKHVTAPPPRPSTIREGVPLVVDLLVSRCLAKIPGERFADMSELARAVAMAQADVTGNDLAPTVISSDWRRPTPAPAPVPTTLSSAVATSSSVSSSSSPRRAIGIGLAIAVAVGVAFWMLVTGAGDADERPTPATSPLAAPALEVDARVDIVIDGAPETVDAAVSAIAPDDAAAAIAMPPLDAAVAKPSKRKPTRVKPVEDPYALPK